MKALSILLQMIFGLQGVASLADENAPNLLIIHTDEHNFRTLGCYREHLSDDQAFIWGEGVKVDTPHIDSIAHEGALFRSFYATSPVCTPSRASFVSGLYPVATGSPANERPLNDGIVTFAEILQRNGYATAYVGKWHLDGDAKPGWAPARKFGFEDNRYMYNRGHWKILKDTDEGPRLIGNWDTKAEKYRYQIEDATAESFTTDFLVDRTLEIIARDKEKPFCVMLSLPDPHGPNSVRAPYDTMYTNLAFDEPRTMRATPEQTPKWHDLSGRNAVTELNQRAMAQYFGMVKCIDDNVGRILQYLKDSDLDEETIVVFTSDHGDLMGEHGRHNKGLPFETSAHIPFLIRYPEHIRPGTKIDIACTTADFAPTILGAMGVDARGTDFHGINVSAAFLESEVEVSDDRIVYITNSAGRWVAAVNRRYKLVLSPIDKPWLYDLEKDPDELINFYNVPAYRDTSEHFQAELIRQMKRFDEPLLKTGTLNYR